MFQLTEEQKALRDEARRFATEQIVPHAAIWDRDSAFPVDKLKQAASLGFLNLVQPEECGGTGLSLFDACLVIEELAAGCAGFTTSAVANDLALLPICLDGTEEQKQKFIKPIVTTQKFASFCLSEPGAGSDAAGLSTAVKKVEGGYEITGQKQWITNGGKASQFTVFATLDKKLGHKGICCLIVPADAKGVSTGHHEDKLGQRCSNTVSVTFDQVFVPQENLIRGEGQGFKVAMRTLDASRPMTAIIAVGVARAAMEHSIAYAKERKQFGAAIASFQAVQIMLADMATHIEAARLLTWRSSQLHDAGESASLESSMAKRFAADSGMQITTDAVQIFGGYGYTKEYPVEKLMRDAKLLQIYEGTSQIQRLVIAREILGR